MYSKLHGFSELYAGCKSAKMSMITNKDEMTEITQNYTIACIKCDFDFDFVNLSTIAKNASSLLHNY